MSLRHLSKRIRHCSREMDQQRGDVQRLLLRQKENVSRQARKVPLPAAIGLGFACGFLAQRLLHLQLPLQPIQMYHLFLTWRSL